MSFLLVSSVYCALLLYLEEKEDAYLLLFEIVKKK